MPSRNRNRKKSGGNRKPTTPSAPKAKPSESPPDSSLWWSLLGMRAPIEEAAIVCNQLEAAGIIPSEQNWFKVKEPEVESTAEVEMAIEHKVDDEIETGVVVVEALVVEGEGVGHKVEDEIETGVVEGEGEGHKVEDEIETGVVEDEGEGDLEIDVDIEVVQDQDSDSDETTCGDLDASTSEMANKNESCTINNVDLDLQSNKKEVEEPMETVDTDSNQISFVTCPTPASPAQAEVTFDSFLRSENKIDDAEAGAGANLKIQESSDSNAFTVEIVNNQEWTDADDTRKIKKSPGSVPELLQLQIASTLVNNNEGSSAEIEKNRGFEINTTGIRKMNHRKKTLWRKLVERNCRKYILNSLNHKPFQRPPILLEFCSSDSETDDESSIMSMGENIVVTTTRDPVSEKVKPSTIKENLFEPEGFSTIEEDDIAQTLNELVEKLDDGKNEC